MKKMAGSVGWPEIHNAFNGTVITEMSSLFSELEKDDDLRVILLTGAGKSFCAGADLNWMREVVNQSFEENLTESNALADLFYQIYTFKRPVIGRINGAAISPRSRSVLCLPVSART